MSIVSLIRRNLAILVVMVFIAIEIGRAHV